MTKCFEFRYVLGTSFANQNEAQDLEEYIKDSKINGLVVEGAKIVHGQRVIKVRCNTSKHELIFNLKFVGLESFYQEIKC